MIASLTDPKTKHFDHAPLGTDKLELKGRIDGILNRHPAVGLAVGVVRNGRLEFFYSHGVADVASNTPVTQDTVFRIGSITKTFTAIAVLQLSEQGLVDLDAPVNDYLRAYRLIPAKAGHRPATVRQLLTHTAGLPQLVHPWRAYKPILGETVHFGQPLPTLAEFYRGGLHLVASRAPDAPTATMGSPPSASWSRTWRRPWTATSASTSSSPSPWPIPTLSDRSGSGRGWPPGTGCGPMARTRSATVTSSVSAPDRSTRPPATWPAMWRRCWAGAPGRTARSSDPRPWPACSPHYRPDPRIPGIGLAFFRGEVGGHLVVEELLPGFSSQLSLAPDDGVGVVAFTNGAKSASAWLGTEVSGLLSDVLGIPDQGIGTDVPHHPEFWGELCGWYGYRGSLRDVQRWLVLGAGGRCPPRAAHAPGPEPAPGAEPRPSAPS